MVVRKVENNEEPSNDLELNGLSIKRQVFSGYGDSCEDDSRGLHKIHFRRGSEGGDSINRNYFSITD